MDSNPLRLLMQITTDRSSGDFQAGRVLIQPGQMITHWQTLRNLI